MELRLPRSLWCDDMYPATSSSLRGVTLIELMIAVAILAIISAIAVPAYNGYIRESRLGTARLNADSLRLYLEDFQLDNGTYMVGGRTTQTEQQLFDDLGWSPDGDGDVSDDEFTYSADVTANTFDILVEHTSGLWLRCDDRMGNCCDGDSTNTTGKTGCP